MEACYCYIFLIFHIPGFGSSRVSEAAAYIRKTSGRLATSLYVTDLPHPTQAVAE